MLNPRTNRRPMTRLARFGSLGVLGLVAILVAGLQVARAVEQQPATTTTEASPARELSFSLSADAAGATVTVRGESSEALVATLVALAADPERLQAFLAELQIAASDRAGRAAAETPIRIGGDVPPPRKIHNVHPVYPSAARAAGIEGVVILEATIDPTGEVSGIDVLQSVPELDQAAIAAVEQWRYEPTLVDGVAVPVSMTMTVNFMLPSR